MKTERTKTAKRAAAFWAAIALCVALAAGLAVYAAWVVGGKSAGNTVTVGQPIRLSVNGDGSPVFNAATDLGCNLGLPGDRVSREIIISTDSEEEIEFSLSVADFTMTPDAPEYDERDLYYQTSPDGSGEWTARAKFENAVLIYTASVDKDNPYTLYLRIGLAEETGGEGDGAHPTESLAGHTVAFSIATGAPLAPPTLDAEDVAADKAALDWDAIKNGNDSADNVLTDLTLPISGAHGTDVSWSSNLPAFIASDGTVSRPTFTQGDKTVTLTATITKGATASDTKQFTAVVKAQPMSDNEAVGLAITALTDAAILNGNGTIDNITDNLTLLTTGLHDTGISWSSNNSAAVSAAGTVARPDYWLADIEVELTATVSKNGASGFKVFTVTVKKAVALPFTVAVGSGAVSFTEHSGCTYDLIDAGAGDAVLAAVVRSGDELARIISTAGNYTKLVVREYKSDSIINQSNEFNAGNVTPIITLNQIFDFELNANRPTTVLTGAAGAVQSVKLDGTAITAYTANTNESVPALKFAFTAGAGTFGLGGVTGLEYGEHDLTVETDAAIYEAKAFMVTMVIRDKTDYVIMAGLTNTTNTSGTHPAGTGQSLYAAPVTNFTTSVAYNADSRTNVWGGYFVLGADIDFDDASADGRMYFGDWCGAWRYSGGGTPNTNNGFRGVFDGRGKTIYNFTAWDGAVFGTLGNGGVIRNVSFVNAAMQDIRPSGSRSGHTAFLVQHCAGRIENVTVIGKVDTTYDGTFGGNPWPANGTYSLSMGMMWAGMLTDALFAAGRIENCVVILQNESVINKAIPKKGTTVTANSGEVGPILSQGTRVFATRGENDYAGPQGVIRNSFAFGINPYDETPDGTNVGYYSTTEAITLANPNFETFDGGYWDLSGLLPVPKGLVSWMADNYLVLMPA